MAIIRQQTWTLDVDVEQIPVSMGIETLDPRWQGMDSNGHEHRYDRDRHEYPTLDFVIDAQHWCHGDEGTAPHDPHMLVDESHYECKLCREVVKPGMNPPGHVEYLCGPMSATLSGHRRDGVFIIAIATRIEVDAIAAGSEAERDEIVQRILDNMPEDRILSTTFGP